jgi:hypothetical protein
MTLWPLAKVQVPLQPVIGAGLELLMVTMALKALFHCEEML